MQPEIPHTPVNGAEQMPLPPNISGEQIPVLPPIDAGIERGQERKEQMAEAGAIASDMAAAPLVAAPSTIPIAPTAPGVAISGPVTAADEDLIEKEWVDKAKGIVQATVDDPHARSHQVSQLRRDYRQKRHGENDAGASVGG